MASPSLYNMQCQRNKSFDECVGTDYDFQRNNTLDM